MSEEHPTLEQLENEVLCQIKKFKFEAGDSLVAQSIFIPIYERYGNSDTDEFRELLQTLTKSMETKGYTEEKNGSTFLTQSGYDASLKAN